MFIISTFSIAHAEDASVSPEASRTPIVAATPAPVVAHPNFDSKTVRHKFSFLVEGVSLRGQPSIEPGYELQFARYFGNHVYFGIDLGVLSSGLVQNSNVVLLFGADEMNGKFLKGFNLNCGLLFPGLSHFTNSSQLVYFKPEVFVGLGVGDGWRIALDLAYQLVGQGGDYSGFVLGLRFDRKTEVTTVPVDD